MGGLIERPPLTEEPDSNWRPILIGVVLVVVVVGIVALLLRSTPPKPPAGPPPYAANLKISDVKMSAAENFVGASVTYLDGTVTNTGNQTVIGATVHVTFKDSLGQIAQAEDVPLHVLQTGGPYDDTADLRIAPLAPGQSRQFRLTFEHVSADWNHEYPEVKVTDVSVK
ncbi:MAG TPA: DUF2393 family protein [Terriglobales bacterium]|nr:DUF2393 family protein [Terriglobales bacterium]